MERLTAGVRSFPVEAPTLDAAVEKLTDAAVEKLMEAHVGSQEDRFVCKTGLERETELKGLVLAPLAFFGVCLLPLPAFNSGSP